MALKKSLILSCGLAACLLAASCGSSGANHERNQMVVSVKDQEMTLLSDGHPVKSYKVSTSKFGLGDQPRSHKTPLGKMKVAAKIGCGQPAGAVFKSRRPTGEVIAPNAPGRDPIVSRILWLRGTERHNRNAFHRYIYIHGTPEISRLGSPASYGCIRMDMKDIVDLYDRVGRGADVYVIPGPLSDLARKKEQVAHENSN